jgi:hypothetical protein
MNPKDDMATSAGHNGERKGANGTSKHTYRRTTPVGRVGKNFSKVLRVNSYVTERLSAWVASGCDDKKVAMVLNMAMEIDEMAKQASLIVAELAKSGFQPPKKSVTISFKAGDPVAIVGKYLPKYSALYSDTILRHLEVLKILPSGEVAVQSTSQSTPFMVAKSHIELRG